MPKLTREEEAFEALLEGRSADGSAELDRMMKLVGALDADRRVAAAASPAPAFRDALRRQILAEAERAARISWRERVMASLRERNEAWRRNFRVVAATAMAAMMLMGTGAVFAAAPGSKPGDFLHPAKLAREALRGLVVRAPEPRGDFMLDVARERLREAEGLADAGVQEVPLFTVTFTRMDGASLEATELLVQAFRDGAGTRPLNRLTNFADAQRVGLESLVDRIPTGARLDARRSIEIIGRVGDRVRQILSGCDCPANPLELPVGSVGAGAPVPVPSVACACEPRHRGAQQTEPTGDDQTQPPDDGNPPPPPPPPPPGVDLVPGTDVDDPVNQLLDQVLEDLGVAPPPSPLPAPAPETTPSVSL